MGVDCDPIQRDSTTHDHSDALVLPSAHVDPVYDELYQDQNRTILNCSSFVLSLELIARLYYKMVEAHEAFCLQ